MILQFYHLSPPLSLLVSNSSYLFIQCQLLYTRSSTVHFKVLNCKVKMFSLSFVFVFGGFPHSSVGKESACNAGDPGLIPGSGRSTGEGIGYPFQYSWLPLCSAGKESTYNVGDLGSIPGLGSSPGEGKGYPLQYSGLENSTVHGVTKSCTQLSDLHFHFQEGMKYK